MTENSTLRENLQRLLKKHAGLSVSELARKTQIPQPTLHHLLSGTTKKPRKRVLERLAAFFSISITQLTGNMFIPESLAATIPNVFSVSSIPLIAWELVYAYVAAGDFNILNFNTLIQNDFERKLLVERQLSPYSFALSMPDASMEPIFPEKSLLIFDPERLPQDREYALVYLAEHDQIIFNRYFVEQAVGYLKFEESAQDLRLIKLNLEKDRLLGTLVEVRLQFFK